MVGVILMALVNTSNVQRIDNFHQPFSTLFDTKTIYININFNENRLLILKYILILHIKIGSKSCFYFNFYFKVHIFISHFLE
jgi:hypothetical protein